MSSAACRATRQQLAAVALAGGEAAPPTVQAHLEECAACRHELKTLSAGLAGLRDAEPPPVDDATVRRQIRAATQDAHLVDDEPRLGWLTWRPVAVVAAMGAVLIAVLWWRMGRTPPVTREAMPVLLAGELHAGDTVLRRGAAVERQQFFETPWDIEATVKLPDGSAFRAVGGTRFLLQRSRAIRLTLAVGRVDVIARKQRPESPLAVETAEGEARVMGTQFSVMRQPREVGGVTIVAVAEGAVQVTASRDGQVRVLRPGESVTLDSQPASRPAPASMTAHRGHRPRIRDIRARIRQGHVKEGRDLIEQARAEPTARPPDLAELAIAEAEAELAEGRQASAVERYLDVAARYPQTRQAEQALFAAAQLSVNRAPRSSSSAKLLERYLTEYPHGRFADDARRLQRALERRRREPASRPGAAPAAAPRP